MNARPTLILLTALIVLAVLAPAAATFVTDVWWYESVGYGSVLWRRVGTQAALAVGGGLLALVVVGGTLLAIERTVPRARTTGPPPRVRVVRPGRPVAID